MSGQKIDDHSFWAGGKSKGSVFPEGAKVKHMDSEEGAGAVGKYEDTDAAIKGVQAKGVSQAKKHAMKDGYRY